MKFFRLSLLLGSLGLLVGGLSGCIKEPSFSSTPEISFNRIELRRFTPADAKTQRFDSIFVTINFQDGDGDLGLSDAESQVSPYAYPSQFNSNYFVGVLVKHPNSKTYEPALSLLSGLPIGTGYNGRFDRPSTLTDSKAAPLKGTLTRRMGFGYGDVFVAGDKVRFTISIADRALHVSNTITTDSVVIAAP